MPVPAHRKLTRADLPAELTPETLRRLGLRTLRQLSQHGNGVLDPAEQAQFDAVLAEVKRDTASMLNQSFERARRDGPGHLDPAMRRSYERMQQRLAEQAQRARESFPDLALDAPVDEPEVPEAAADEPIDDVSPGSLEREVEETSTTLDLLERIATLQQQQLEHQEGQLLAETRSFFFAFLVSVAVIIAGVAPLVEAEPHTRLLIVIWTVVATGLAGLVYALVRRVQAGRG